MKEPAARYYRKRIELFRLIEKIKLWPSRRGILHGIKAIAVNGELAEITTHCGKVLRVRNSRNSRAARWLRNKWCQESCPQCAIPEWKLAKYSVTYFKRRHGSLLARPEPDRSDRPEGTPAE